jgi:hypothetical protein
MRIVGLTGLVLGVWALGFFFGRVSAWLVPVTTSQMVTIERIHLRPLAIASDAPASKMAEASAPAPMLRAGSITLASTSETPDQPAGKGPVLRPGSEPRVSILIEDLQRGRAAHAQRRGRHQDDRRFAGGDFRDDALSQCERRFVSFRRSDGTYQPFNRPTRELCPFLR